MAMRGMYRSGALTSCRGGWYLCPPDICRVGTINVQIIKWNQYYLLWLAHVMPSLEVGCKQHKQLFPHCAGLMMCGIGWS